MIPEDLLETEYKVPVKKDLRPLKYQVKVKSLTPKENKVKVSTPKTKYEEYRKSQGYEPYPKKLPNIK